MGQPPTVNIAFPCRPAAVTVDSSASNALAGRQRPHRRDRPLGGARRQRRRPDLRALSARRRRIRLAAAEADITDKAYSFDAALIPDGGYQIKVVASDAPSHTPGDALTGAKVSERFEVDTTPPVVSALKASLEPLICAGLNCAGKIRVTFDAEDAFSPIAHAEYSLDAGPWQYIEPVGGLSDSRREHYDVLIPVPAEAKSQRAPGRRSRLRPARQCGRGQDGNCRRKEVGIMRFELYIAARYLKAKRRQAVVGVVTTISIAGVAAGVAALIIALAITNGMRRDLQDRLLGASSQVDLMRVQSDGISDWQPLLGTPAPRASRHRSRAGNLRAGAGFARSRAPVSR
jgi:hypothetical protein